MSGRRGFYSGALDEGLAGVAQGINAATTLTLQRADFDRRLRAAQTLAAYKLAGVQATQQNRLDVERIRQQGAQDRAAITSGQKGFTAQGQLVPNLPPQASDPTSGLSAGLSMPALSGPDAGGLLSPAPLARSGLVQPGDAVVTTHTIRRGDGSVTQITHKPMTQKPPTQSDAAHAELYRIQAARAQQSPWQRLFPLRSSGIPPAPAGRVTVRAPDGRIGHIPASQVDDATAQGYTVLDANH